MERYKKILHSLSPKHKILFQLNCEKILINRYKREYFRSKNKKLRVTLDQNIQIYDQRFALEKQILQSKIIRKIIWLLSLNLIKRIKN